MAAGTEVEENGGAYRLFIRVPRAIRLQPGRLGMIRLEAGEYLYVGSAKRNLRQRVARHCRLAQEKRGKRHWHIDALLLHPWSRLVKAEALPGGEECQLVQAALAAGAVAAAAGYGATDCRAGCPAHLLRLLGSTTL